MSKLRMEKKSPLCVETISVAITSAFSFSVWTCITWILLLHLHSLSLHPLPTATCTLIHIDRNNIWFVVLSEFLYVSQFAQKAGHIF